MDGDKLTDIRNSLYMLPELKKKLQKLGYQIRDCEEEVKSLLSRLDTESYDVERLKQDSLSVTLLKLVRQYDQKLEKEMKDELAAKINYDKAVNNVKELKSQYEDILSRISKLQNDKELYDEEIKKRENILMNNINDEASIKYRKLEADREQLAHELLEIQEAKKAAMYVEGTVSAAIEHLESAEKWATYDVWTRGGIISHMAKYDQIDDAQEDINRLDIQLNALRKELADVHLFQDISIVEIDGTQRMIDFWFDNIFTDLNVRSKIRDNMDQLDNLYNQVGKIEKSLESNIDSINQKLKNIESAKRDFLINSYS